MKKKTVLVTGASGEIGHGLIEHLANDGGYEVIALDLKRLSPDLEARCSRTIEGDILGDGTLAEIAKSSYDAIFHLAAILSTEGERNPARTHRVNVDGSLNLLELAREQSARRGSPVKLIFPSTIAVFGLRPDETDRPIREDECLEPVTMYGLNKLYVEQLGRYYSTVVAPEASRIDFRCVRLPGVVSGVTVPTGGTSDYFPEMLHAAAKGEPYRCFVTPEAQLPFMVMPDAVKALVDISLAPRERLTRTSYNVTSFSLSASEISERIKALFPEARIGYGVDERRLAIVRSWPRRVDDDAARRDWDWKPAYGVDASFTDYLVPKIAARYGGTTGAAKLAEG